MIYPLQHWSTLLVTGNDALAFLQNLLTQDMHIIESTGWSCLLNNKSKVISLMGVETSPEGFCLMMHKDVLESTKTSLERYIITEDVEIQALDTKTVYVDFSAQGVRVSTHKRANQPLIQDDVFETQRIARGFPRYAKDYFDPLPLEVPFMHQAISFTKGCFVGQETVARLYSRGMNVSKQLSRVQTKEPIQEGDKVFLQDGTEVGEVTSSATADGITHALSWVSRKGFDQPLFVGASKVPTQNQVHKHKGD